MESIIKVHMDIIGGSALKEVLVPLKRLSNTLTSMTEEIHLDQEAS